MLVSMILSDEGADDPVIGGPNRRGGPLILLLLQHSLVTTLMGDGDCVVTAVDVNARRLS